MIAQPARDLLQATIDALPAQIAVLNDSGRILAVNCAWRDGPDDRIVHDAPGDLYLSRCDHAVVDGIQAILAGERESFSFEYQGGSAHERCWFALHVAPLRDGDLRGAVLSHEDITTRVEAEEARGAADRTLDALVHASPLAILALDAENRVTAWNPAAEELFGWTRAEVLGRFNPIVPDSAMDQFFDIVARLGKSDTEFVGMELRRQRKDGTLLDVASSVAALRTADGEVRGSMAVLTDITEQKRVREDRRFLAEVSDLLASSIDYETTLTQIAHLAVPRLADLCMVHLLEDDESIRRLAIAHADPERQELAQRLKDHGRLQLDDSWGVPVVMRTGRAALYPTIPETVWQVGLDLVEHMEVIQQLGMTSAMFVPLIVRDRTIGTLTFVYGDSGRTYTETDLGLATELGRRAATAIDAAQLYREARDAELRYRSLVEHFPAATYIARTDDLRAITYVSPQMTGTGLHSAEELAADPGLRMAQLHPDDRERVEQAMLSCSASGKPLNIEYRTITPAGDARWIVDRATLIRDDTGQPLYWQGICLDIDERKHGEEALRVRARQQAAVAQLGQRALDDIDLSSFLKDAVRVVRETLEIEYVSLARYDPASDILTFAAAAGWTPDEVSLGPLQMEPRSLTSYAFQTRKPVVVLDLKLETRFSPSRYMVEQGITSCLAVVVPGQDHPRGILAAATPRQLVFSEYDVHFLQAIGNLLASAIERIEDEAEIRFQASLLDVVNQAVMATDLDGRIIYWNRYAEQLYGWSQKEVLGRSIVEVTPTSTTPEQSEHIQETLRAGRSWSGEFSLQRRDGSIFPALVTDAPIFDARGETMGIVGVSTDISAMKAAQQEREQLVHDLGERVKELTVLHQAAGLLQNERLSLWEILEELASMLPQAMQYPEATAARVALGAMESATPGFRESDTMIQAGFAATGGVQGTIEVSYLPGSSIADEPFPAEEVSLVNTVAEMLGGYLQRLSTQAELHRSETNYRAAAEGSLDAFFIFEAVRDDDLAIVDYRIVDMNARGEEFTGHSRDEFTGRTLLQFYDVEQMTPFYEMFGHVASSGETTERELQILDGSGAQRWLQCQGVPLADGVAVSLRDITDRKRLEEQLTYQAFHDALTGLPNRALFLDRVQHARSRALRRHEGVAVLFLDLDNFKVINDSLGHSTGDQLLIAVADRLTSCLGSDDSAARLGGDEFAILVEDLGDWAVATATAEAIVETFRDPFNLAGREVFISPSVGVAFGTSHSTTAEDLLRDADAAMYRAKRKGKARYEVFEPSLALHARQRFELENDLRHAIDRNELCLHYQPVVDLKTGMTSGVEALVRWEHPAHGLMAPLDFIPIAEETGLIIPIGRWVLKRACRQVNEWNRERPGAQPLMVSVNLSRQQFHDPRLSHHVSVALENSGLDPSLLGLEITESVMMEDEMLATRALEQLKRLGIQLAIDDFGTGYSSLGVLRHFPVDSIKIDRTFISGLATNPGDAVIVSGIIGLAHALGLDVVAEGTETAEQVERMTTLGCNFAQGFYFGRPQPWTTLVELTSGLNTHP